MPTFPATALYPSASGTFPSEPDIAAEVVRLVREGPPLRQHIEAITPSGRHYRWGEDEPRPENVFADLRHSSTMPGGYESCEVTLPRKPGVDYSDLERLTTLRVIGAGGQVDGEYRLERAPRVSRGSDGDQSAGGWVAGAPGRRQVGDGGVCRRDQSRWQGRYDGASGSVRVGRPVR